MNVVRRSNQKTKTNFKKSSSLWIPAQHVYLGHTVCAHLYLWASLFDYYLGPWHKLYCVFAKNSILQQFVIMKNLDLVCMRVQSMAADRLVSFNIRKSKFYQRLVCLGYRRSKFMDNKNHTGLKITQIR